MLEVIFSVIKYHKICLAVFDKVLEITTGGGISLGEQQPFCGDYIFSGHTMMLVTGYLVVRDCE